MANPALEFYGNVTRSDKPLPQLTGTKRAQTARAARVNAYGLIVPGAHSRWPKYEMVSDVVTYELATSQPFTEVELRPDASFAVERYTAREERWWFDGEEAASVQLFNVVTEFMLHTAFYARYLKRLGISGTCAFSLGLRHFDNGIVWWEGVEEIPPRPEGMVWQTRYAAVAGVTDGYALCDVEIADGKLPQDLLPRIADEIVRPIMRRCRGHRLAITTPTSKDDFDATTESIVAQLQDIVSGAKCRGAFAA